MILQQNVSILREEAAKYSRQISFIAATKTQTADTVAQFAALAPDFEFGENRAVELVEKYDPAYTWHFIGQLQSNKAHCAVGKVRLIQSLDRQSLANEIDRLAAKQGITQGCLIEVNMGGEEAKGGVSPDEVFDFIYSLERYEHIKVEGLMSVLPRCDGLLLEGYYDRLYNIFEQSKGIKTANCDIKYLSAGMSDDWKVALKYGSNMLRLGRFLFGERH